jgi:hypothetical protein
VKIEDIRRKQEYFEELYFSLQEIEDMDVAKILEHTDAQRKRVFIRARKDSSSIICNTGKI